MAAHVGRTGNRPPRSRIGTDGKLTFFPNEVVQLLDLPQIDYSQLRFFYKLIRAPHDPDSVGRSWSRFTIEDMAALTVALEICGSVDSLQAGRRLTRVGLPEALMALHSQGFQVPLLQVGLVRLGRRVVADVDGVLVDPVTGQRAMAHLLKPGNSYVERLRQREPELASRLETEILAVGRRPKMS